MNGWMEEYINGPVSAGGRKTGVNKVETEWGSSLFNLIRLRLQWFLYSNNGGFGRAVKTETKRKRTDKVWSLFPNLVVKLHIII